MADGTVIPDKAVAREDDEDEATGAGPTGKVPVAR